MGGGEGEGGVAVLGLEDAIAAGLESLANELADGIFVLDEENGFGSAGGGGRNWSGTVSFGGLVDAREINGEDCDASEFALDEDVSAALFDDAVDGGESEAGAFAFFFGGEKRFEDASLGFAVHALAGIADGNHYVGAVFDDSVFGAVGLVESAAAGADASFPAAGHSVFGIDHEVHDDLFELASVGAGTADVGSKAGGEFDIFA